MCVVSRGGLPGLCQILGGVPEPQKVGGGAGGFHVQPLTVCVLLDCLPAVDGRAPSTAGQVILLDAPPQLGARV